MILIADSGSTKTEWQTIKGSEAVQFATQGYNPYFWEADSLRAAMRVALGGKVPQDRVEQVHFYGAGCSSDDKTEIIKNALKENFPEASIYVYHDLLGSARALCGNNPGMAAILGTGSNSCYYDGENIVENVESLGFILGDEGSGTHIGKAMIKTFLYKEMPMHLSEAFYKEHPYNRVDILDKIYKQALPNRFLASFATFATVHKHEPFIIEIVGQCFKEFLERQVCKYKRYKEVPLGVVGSVGFHFKEILEDACRKKGIELGTVMKSPIQALASYHSQ